MALSKKEAEIIQNSIDSAHQEAREAKNIAVDTLQAINRLADKVQRLGETVQKAKGKRPKPRKTIVCPHCGESIDGGS